MPVPCPRPVVLLELQCRAPGCQVTFFLCTHCYRGQCYCGPECQAKVRTQQLRAANARHQRSEPGRLDHRDRQKAYRERLRAGRVTYPSSPAPDSAPSSQHAFAPAPDSAPSSHPPSNPDVPDAPSPRPAPRRSCRPSNSAGPRWRCSICGRPGIPASLRRLYGCWLAWFSRSRQASGP